MNGHETTVIFQDLLHSTNYNSVSELLTELERVGVVNWYREHKKLALSFTRAVNGVTLAPGRFTFRQAVWHASNEVWIIPICSRDGCDNVVVWNSTTHQYQQFCSNKCVHADGTFHSKRKQTLKHKYGVENIFSDVARIKQARQQALGVEHPMQSETVRMRAKDTCITKYGVDHPWKLQRVHDKCVTNRSYDFLTPEQQNCLKSEEWLTTKLVLQHLTLSQVAAEIGVAPSTVGLYAKNSGIKHRTRSKVQQQLYSWVQHLLPDDSVIADDRSVITPQELDIVIPSKHLAIELNGVYWHCESNGKEKTYHIHKTHRCNNKGFELIHITDVEWSSRTDAIQSLLASLLITTPKPSTRAVDISHNTASHFFATYEIAAPVDSHHTDASIGVLIDDQLVAAATISDSTITNAWWNGMSISAEAAICALINQTLHRVHGIIVNTRFGLGSVLKSSGLTQALSFIPTPHPVTISSNPSALDLLWDCGCQLWTKYHNPH